MPSFVLRDVVVMVLPLVIDANVVKAYFEEAELALPSRLTGSTLPIFGGLGPAHQVAYVDTGNKIEQEWRNVVQPEWFNAWFAGMLASGAVEMVEPTTRGDIIKVLKVKHGFPGDQSDRWYVLTACAVVQRTGGGVALISEDLDFYEPREKKCGSSRRQRILMDSAGKVAKHLRKCEQVYVRSVAVQLAAP